MLRHTVQGKRIVKVHRFLCSRATEVKTFSGDIVVDWQWRNFGMRAEKKQPNTLHDSHFTNLKRENCFSCFPLAFRRVSVTRCASHRHQHSDEKFSLTHKCKIARAKKTPHTLSGKKQASREEAKEKVNKVSKRSIRHCFDSLGLFDLLFWFCLVAFASRLPGNEFSWTTTKKNAAKMSEPIKRRIQRTPSRFGADRGSGFTSARVISNLRSEYFLLNRICSRRLRGERRPHFFFCSINSNHRIAAYQIKMSAEWIKVNLRERHFSFHLWIATGAF